MEQREMRNTGRVAFTSPILALVVLATFLQCTPALRFYLHDRERRCFKFDAPFRSRVIGARSVANGPGTAELSVEVKNTNGRIVYESHGSDPKDSKFAFISPDFNSDSANEIGHDDYEYEDFEGDANYHVCLMLSFDAALHKSGKRAVTFWIRADSTQQGKPSEKRATEETMGTVTQSLQDMHKILQQMISDLSVLQQRERRLVNRSKATAQRLSFFASVALIVLISTAGFQFLFFKAFFKSKKLL